MDDNHYRGALVHRWSGDWSDHSGEEHPNVWSRVTWREKAEDLVLELDESRRMVRDLEEDIALWQQNMVHADAERDKLKRQL